MPVLKLHSEQSVAAHVAKGWTLSRVFYNGDDREGYEYLVRREEPALPRASHEEVSGARRAVIVEELFEIHERGVVAAPGIPIESNLAIADGDLAVVIGRQSAAVFPVSPMVGLNLKSPFRPIMLRGASKSDIEIGSSIWIPHQTNSEQGVAPQPAARPESNFSGSLPPST